MTEKKKKRRYVRSLLLFYEHSKKVDGQMEGGLAQQEANSSALPTVRFAIGSEERLAAAPLFFDRNLPLCSCYYFVPLGVGRKG